MLVLWRTFHVIGCFHNCYVKFLRNSPTSKAFSSISTNPSPELRCSLAREPRVFKPSYTLSLIYIYTLPLVKRSQPTSSQHHHHHRTQTTPRIPQSLKKIPCHDAIPSIFSNSNDTELSARAPLPILSQKKSTRNPASCSE